MKKFIQLPENLREALATQAGIMLTDFDPEATADAETIRANILFATTGGVNPTCIANYTDFGEDVDNCPKNTMELAEIESYECGISGTALTVDSVSAAYLFGVADKTAGKTDKELVIFQPRMDTKKEDFKTMWYVCPYGTGEGFVAVKLENALNTGGFSMQSADRAKGTFAFSFTGFSSIDAPRKVPFTFYIKPSAASEAVQVDVTETEGKK